MNFEDFARSHGLILNGLQSDRWIATPTEDHPHKRNGRYKWLGDIGWVQNWATMDRPAMWKAQGSQPGRIRQAIQNADLERQKLADKAASKAAWILHQCQTAGHSYLEKKGFPDEAGNVWVEGERKTLVIPMRRAGRLVGCQMIDEQGGKKFLYGQASKGAVFVLDAKGLPILCEGYATALSVRAVMKANKIRYSIYVCFSASNLEHIARDVLGGIVVADNDPNGVGEKVARKTGKPYWLSDAVGEDFNDYHCRVGLFKASQGLKSVLVQGNVLTGAQTSPRSA